MFSRKNKSNNPIGWAMDTWLDGLLKKQKKPSHKVRNGLIGVGIVTVGAVLASKPKKDV